jgi:hypothetical protein
MIINTNTTYFRLLLISKGGTETLLNVKVQHCLEVLELSTRHQIDDMQLNERIKIGMEKECE